MVVGIVPVFDFFDIVNGGVEKKSEVSLHLDRISIRDNITHNGLVQCG